MKRIPVEELASLYATRDQQKQIVASLKQSFHSGKTAGLEFRLDQLRGIVDLLLDHKQELVEALYADFKCKEEALQEWSRIVSEAMNMIDNLQDWVKPRPISTSLGAIAAGCCAVIKPAEDAATTAQLLFDLMPRYLDCTCYSTIVGAANETSWLLEEPWDLVFFTGGNKVGKIVYEATAKHLTPAVLELGGCNPCLVLADADISCAAKRIVHGKFLNAGQTCLAPNLVICDKCVIERLREEIVKVIKEFYGSDASRSNFYGRLVSERRWDIIDELIGSIDPNEVLYSGGSDRASRYFGPCVVSCQKDSKLLDQEIFGPILPLVSFDGTIGIDEICKQLSKTDRSYPLAAYLFTNNKLAIDKFVQRVPAGAILVNDTVVHYLVDALPFGGFGHSGMGTYHGRNSFEVFSHGKPVMQKHSLFTERIYQKIRYPNQNEKEQPGWIGQWLSSLIYGKASAKYRRNKPQSTNNG